MGIKASGVRVRRHDFHNGQTNATGVWTVQFDPPFQTLPHLSVGLVAPDTETAFRIVSLTPTGFSLHVYRRTSLSVLGINLMSFATSNVALHPCWALAVEVY